MGCGQSAKKGQGIAAETPAQTSTTQQTAETAEATAAPTITEVTTPEERALKQLKLVFETIDADKNGGVSKEELTLALKKDKEENGHVLSSLVKESGMNPDRLTLADLDVNNDGRVSWDEFVHHLKSAAVQEVVDTGNVAAAEVAADAKALEQLRSIFKGIDANADGSVSKTELKDALQKDDNLKALMKEAGFNPQFSEFDKLDLNHDNRLSWDEFETHFRSQVTADVQATAAIEVRIDGEEENKTVCCFG